METERKKDTEKTEPEETQKLLLKKPGPSTFDTKIFNRCGLLRSGEFQIFLNSITIKVQLPKLELHFFYEN